MSNSKFLEEGRRLAAALHDASPAVLEFLERLHDDDECWAAFKAHRPSIREAKLHADIAEGGRAHVAELYHAIEQVHAGIDPTPQDSARDLLARTSEMVWVQMRVANRYPDIETLKQLVTEQRNLLTIYRRLLALRDAIPACR